MTHLAHQSSPGWHTSRVHGGNSDLVAQCGHCHGGETIGSLESREGQGARQVREGSLAARPAGRGFVCTATGVRSASSGAEQSRGEPRCRCSVGLPSGHRRARCRGPQSKGQTALGEKDSARMAGHSQVTCGLGNGRRRERSQPWSHEKMGIDLDQ